MCVCVCVCVCVYVCVRALSHVSLFVTLWTVAHQTPLFMGFSRQEYRSGLPFPSPGDLPDPGIHPEWVFASPASAGRLFATSDTLVFLLSHLSNSGLGERLRSFWWPPIGFVAVTCNPREHIWFRSSLWRHRSTNSTVCPAASDWQWWDMCLVHSSPCLCPGPTTTNGYFSSLTLICC